MICSRCGKNFDENGTRCPRCGASQADASGLFQTSTVLISSGGADLVYRSVEEIPSGLRTKLLRSTSGGNSGTIVIADRRGRQEVAKALGKLPDAVQRNLVKTILGVQGESGPAKWLTPGRKRAIVAMMALLTLALVAWVFSHHWQ